MLCDSRKFKCTKVSRFKPDKDGVSFVSLGTPRLIRLDTLFEVMKIMTKLFKDALNLCRANEQSFRDTLFF